MHKAIFIALGAALTLGCGASDASSDGGRTRPTTDAGGIVRPAPIDGGLLAASCGLENPAFCETFETPSPGGRGGDLDERTWSFSRWAHAVQFLWGRLPAHTYPERMPPFATFCGDEFSGIMPPDDVRTCDGIGVDGHVSHQLNEVFDDQGDFAFQSMMIRQPFDFTDRTGTIVWDVDAKQNRYNAGHGWWTEIWITEDPAPMPYHDAPGGVFSFPRRGIGIQFARTGGEVHNAEDGSWWGNSVGRVIVVENHQVIHEIPHWELSERPGDDDGFVFHTYDTVLNHFELRLTRDRVEVYVTDSDDPGNLRFRMATEGLDLGFSVGYVHFQHSHYNAGKDGMTGCNEAAPGLCPTSSQTYRWDNIGFDGPRYATPRAYDVADNHERIGEGVTRLGYAFTPEQDTFTFVFPGVDRSDAVSASLDGNLYSEPNRVIEYRFNDGPLRTFTVPETQPAYGTFGLRSLAIPLALEDLRDGDNTLTVRAPDPQRDEMIGNLDLTLNVSR